MGEYGKDLVAPPCFSGAQTISYKVHYGPGTLNGGLTAARAGIFPQRAVGTALRPHWLR